MLNKRKILIVTGSRGEYGYIRPAIKMMYKSTIIEPKILVTNMHLLPQFGDTIREFEKDSILVNYKIYMALDGYTNITMIKSLGVFMLSFSDIIENQRPDFILLAGDRGEQLIAAMVGAYVNIPVAHIQAGELSGNIDGVTRHAIARFAHIHFTANKDAEKRLIKMGEAPFRIFNVGAPQLDEFAQNEIIPKEEILKTFSFKSDKSIIVVVQHPITEQAHLAYQQMEATLKAVKSFNAQTVIIYPNNDAGSIAIQKCIHENRNIDFKIVKNLSREEYGGLLNIADVLVGNSSSGIIEAPFFKLPTVNIGRRQKGRFRGQNVIDVVEHNENKIKTATKRALSEEFRDTLKNMKSPYGDGHSSEKILEILETISINEKLVCKEITY